MEQEIKPFYIEGNDISDGHHTFKELYEYRLVYNALLFNEWAKLPNNPYDVHLSYKHSDGEPCFGIPGRWFIVVAQLPTGQISNHYKMEFERYFYALEKRDKSAVYDGHTPRVACNRMIEHLTDGRLAFNG